MTWLKDLKSHPVSAQFNTVEAVHRRTRRGKPRVLQEFLTELGECLRPGVGNLRSTKPFGSAPEAIHERNFSNT